MNAVESFIYNFGLAYSASVLISVAGLLIKFKKTLKSPLLIIYALIRTDYMKFACFPAIYSFVMKSSFCFLENHNQKHKKYNAFISGFLAGVLSLSSRPAQNR